MPPIYRFIVNPKSGCSVNATPVRRLRDHIRARGFLAHIDLTQSLEHATELAHQAAQSNCQGVVVAGGDGTVRAVAAGMAGSELPLLIVPTGTENLFAGELGLDGSEEVTLAALDHGVIRKLDLGRANGRCFIAIVGVGFDAEVVQRINRFRTGHITHRDYLWPICRTFWEHRFPTLNIVADGRRICDQPALLFVSNISRYAVGLKITPHADFSSSYLDVTVYKCHKRRQLLLHSALTILGQSHRSPDVIRTRCRRLIVNCADLQVPVQLDGDPGPKLPLEINVLPSTARVLAPPPPDHPHHCPPARLYRLRRSLVR